MDESMKPPWSELPEDLLALVFARIFSPAERAGFQIVCRSWRSAARPPPPPRQLPWIMLPFGGFLNPSDRVLRRHISFHKTASSIASADYYNPLLFSFPKTTRCVGSTDGWIAMDCADHENNHTYYLHNEFSSTTLSLPELDAAIGHVSELFEIRKVLLRSTPDDIIALMTNHCSCPIILTQRGKGVWLPKWHAEPLTLISDVAFLGDRLYGITQAEHLVFLDIASDENGIPTITGGECVIGKHFDVWSNEEDYDDEEEDNDEEEDGDDVDHAGGGDDSDSSDCEDEYKNDDEEDDEDDEEEDGDDVDDAGGSDDDDSSDCKDDYENDDEEDDDDTKDYDDLTKMTEDDIIDEAIQDRNIDESPHATISTRCYLIESRGELLMVRRQVLSPHNGDFPFTHKVEVFEADIRATKWVPLEGGLGGQALFVSRPFCKSISAACSKEIQENTIYFIDTDDVFHMRSKTVSAPRDDWDYTMNLRNGDTKQLTWVFPPELLA